MANEYIFFDEGLRDSFVRFVAERGVAGSLRADEIDGFVVALPDDLDDDLEDAIEDEYEVLMAAQRDLVEAGEGGEAKKLMGVSVVLPDGETRMVRLPGDYARRLLEQFTIDEIRDMVTAIARDVAVPLTGPICRQP